MKSAYQVKIAFKEAIKQADKIDDIAVDVEKERQRLEDERSALIGCWRGNNARDYCKKIEDRKNELLGVIHDLKNIAQVIRDVAETAYVADMKSIQHSKRKN